MADRKEWKEQLLSKLLDQYEKSVTYTGENKVKQVFSVKPSDIFKGYNKDFLPPEQLFQEKEPDRKEYSKKTAGRGLSSLLPMRFIGGIWKRKASDTEKQPCEKAG